MAEEKIPRKKLIKLCRKLQERVRTVETKHASVVKKYQSVKAEGDAAKAKILELQAQIDGMEEEFSTQQQLMKMQMRKHAQLLRERSIPSPSGGGGVPFSEGKHLRSEIENLKVQIVEAKAAPSASQESEIASLKSMVNEYKQKALKALQGEGGEGGSEEQRLRIEVSRLIEECDMLRREGGGGDHSRKHIASLTSQLLSARKEVASVREEFERLSDVNHSLKERIRLASEENQTGRVLLRQKEELEHEKSAWMQQMMRQKESLTKLEKKYAEAEARAKAAEEKGEKLVDSNRITHSQVTEYAVKISALEQQISEREAMHAELVEACAEAKINHEKKIQEAEARHRERYSRLLREFTAHREESKRTERSLEAKLAKTETQKRRLQDQIATGKPDERRIFELAELQARREHKIRQVSDQMKSHVQIIAQHKEAIDSYRAKIKDLNYKLDQERQSKKRSGVNLDYLKAILVNFMQLKDDRAAQISMYPVIAKVLCFSEEELAMVRKVMTEQGIYSYVTSFIWTQDEDSQGLLKHENEVEDAQAKQELPPMLTENGEKELSDSKELMGEI
ncbi:hypothetical protein AAMO2058_000132100 [Amorphochlora amoebiformis]